MTRSSTGTAPDATSATGTQATASVVPPDSATRGSAAGSTVAEKTRWTPWKSSQRPLGAVPEKWESWTSIRSPTSQAPPHS